ncbi:MAG TPA: tRNA (N6-isopentenyl adenosine(37)-C2)-methylthiotransferase MiaB [Candidatus Omnitrophica bacterium]|nr:tRNA (N6-isopentenyl adenosine(37)-C2)-methylthiotransferase MiaB [Candidatus Omnitrophota bacterium]
MNKQDAAKKVFLRSFGCQMNARDSEVVKGLVLAEGYGLTDDPAAADIVLFNTCSVRQHAEDRVWSAIGNIAKMGVKRGTAPKYRGKAAPAPKKIIGVIGCMAQNYKEGIFKKAPAVDIVCGPSEIDNIALYLDEVIRSKKNVLAVSEKKRKEDVYHTGFYEAKDHAYVVISEGCDNYCTYCVVPYVRGRLRHRAASEIIKETEHAVRAGIVNITLLGQNVNAYKCQVSSIKCQVDFQDLLKKVSQVKGLKSLSFLTSHPKDTTNELFEVMRDTPVIKKCLHMPVQSGSDKMLKAMNRGYTVKKYHQLVDQYRGLVYNGQLSTDVIVGFPGETEEDFGATKKLLKSVCFDSAYIFKYSPRLNTEAALLADDVPKEVKERRHAELLGLQKEISRKKVSSCKCQVSGEKDEI